MVSRDHLTVHVKSNDQSERFPNNTRGAFCVELNSKYKLDPLKKYTACINYMSVNNDIDDVRVLYKEVNPKVNTTLVWEDDDLCIPKNWDWSSDDSPMTDEEFYRRVHLPKHSYIYDKTGQHHYLPLSHKKFYLDTVDPEVHLERAKERFGIEMYTWEPIIPFKYMDEKYKANQPAYIPGYEGRYFPDENCFAVQAKILGTNSAVLTIVLYITTTAETVQSRFVYFCETDIPNLTLTRVYKENGEESTGVKLTVQSMYNFIRDVIGNSYFGRAKPLSYIGDSTYYRKGWSSMDLVPEYKRFTMQVPDEVRTIMDLEETFANGKPMTIDNGTTLHLWRWHEKVHYINTRLYQHFCIELKDCENNTLSTRARSILKVCPLKTPSSSKTQYKYLHMESLVPEHVEITSDHIRQLSFMLTDIYGEPLKFRNIEEEQAAFPTLVSLTIKEHGEH